MKKEIEKGKDYILTFKNGQTVEAYRTFRATWCNSNDCKTEYKDSEVINFNLK